MNEPPNPEVAVFAAALELPAEQRGAYLDQACAGDAALRRQVEALLRVHDDAGNFFDKLTPAARPISAEGAIPGLGGTIRLPGIPTENAGDRIGRYKLLQQIGEGGCGVVYMAEQEEPVRRRVALKVIKLGMDTKSVIARFEAERQALALMDHPNIAKVLEAGATDTGRPYFVMELVRGIKITDYCDENNLSTSARLELFIQVCQAIQHAHQKGIIHRDIKPSNILVTVNDGVAVPKVIDFGIAKATQGRLTDHTLFTAFEQFLGTPAYMSPEQAVMTSLDIDTRSDIYSLGVLLYELLTSQTPFDAKELLQAGLDEIRRTIREQEPACPSTRLSTMLDADLTTIAKHRKIESLKLVNLVRGDLDWIVMKALEKDRTRRYETANGLAADIQRHLSNEPVVACPPGNLYKFHKMVRRNKLAFACAAIVIAALALGFGVSTRMFLQERQARREQDRLRLEAQAKEQSARTEAAKSQEVTKFLESMLDGVAPSVALGRDTTMLREILDKTAERIGKNLKDQPEVEADLRSVMGDTYSALGRNVEAEAMHREAMAIYIKLHGDENLPVASLLNTLAGETSGQSRHADAEALERASLAIRRKLLGNENVEVAESLAFLGLVLLREGIEAPESLKQSKFVEAETSEREALAMRIRLLGKENLDVAQSLEDLTGAVNAQGNFGQSETFTREALAIRIKLLGKENLQVAASLLFLADALNDQGKRDEAENFYREALAMRRKLCGNEHPDVAYVLAHLAILLQREGRLPEAEAANREALAVWRKSLGDEHPFVLGTINFMAGILRDEGKLSEAEGLFREALNIRRKVLGNEHPETIESLNSLVEVLKREGKLTEARELLENRPATATEEKPGRH